MELRVNQEMTMDGMQELEDHLMGAMRAIAKADARNKKDTEKHSDPEDTEKRKHPNRPGGMGDISDRKAQTLRPLKAFFDDKDNKFLNWNDAQRENITLHRIHEDALVPGTAEWLFTNAAWDQWRTGGSSLLWLRGEDGVGKSFLSFASVRKLLNQADGSTVAYFHFRETVACLQSVQNAIACTALQIAKSDPKYAKYIGNKLADNENKAAKTTPWQRLFLSAYGDIADEHGADAPLNSKVYMIFDGLDELPEEQLHVFKLFLADMKRSSSRIRILVSSRPQQSFIEKSDPLVIDITKAKMTHDINIFLRDRLNSYVFPRLKSFSSATKKMIRRKIIRQADGVLYADHMLRRLSYIGREGAVLQELEDMPQGLSQLYKVLLGDCRRGRSKEQYEALKKLFAWIAFSTRPLSLAEASELAGLTIAEEDLDIEDEVIGRSARILEIFPPSRTEDDNQDQNKEDTDDEDDEYTSEETPVNVDEYRKAPLMFHERSLHQYFRAVSTNEDENEELRTPARTAHTTIMAMGTRARAEKIRGEVLDEHFNKIDVDTATETEIGQMLECLHSILTDEKRISRVFDHFADPSELYPEAVEGEPIPWDNRVTQWTAKAATLPDGVITADVKAWASELAKDEKHVLWTLSKAHVRNWLGLRSQVSILQAYRTAEATTRICGQLEATAQDPLKEILSVAQHFNQTLDEKGMRAVGVTLFHADLSACSDAIATYKTYNLSLQTAPPTEFRKVYLWNDRADVMLWSLYRTKASYLANLDEKSQAFQAYEEARRLASNEWKGFLNGWVLEDIAQLFDEDEDPDGHRLMDALKTWTDRELQLWFDYSLIPYADMDALERMFRAAKLTGETHLVPEWLHKYGRKLAPRSLTAFNLQFALADFYSSVTGDTDKAKAVMRTILTMQHPSIDATTVEILDNAISETRLALAGIIFSQFSSSHDPLRKEELVQEMKHLPGTHGSEVSFLESHIGMLYANMLRIMGPAREYEKYMNELFETCVKGLADDDFYNDGPALRLLAKVLSSLEGLEFDARVALSAQFSVPDRDVQRKALAWKSVTSSDDDDVDDDGEAVESSASVVVIDKQDHAHEQTHDSIVVEPNITDTEAISSNPPPTNTTPTPLQEEETDDQDLEGEDSGGIECDGCGTTLYKWDQPLYLCLICPNTDLCVACHDKKRGLSEEQDSKAWRRFCDAEHRFIKGPMKGWKEVKNGVVRVEGREAFTVGEWLKGMKGERWPEAWGRYWRRPGGLRDVDVGD
ncbi:hypothetical protein CC80DRAFT_534088 [Byssothecium circinans]|uniref:Nephrocystin 3-like N-terminal domain-containing protein n=1 Tax=Byssothecium circinans TaxID=147558 RepID=A0A6A5U2X2_9PLEO|nr:hypothetical protein CC80DRAFT_534088 [Byssothecium circinans]